MVTTTIKRTKKKTQKRISQKQKRGKTICQQLWFNVYIKLNLRGKRKVVKTRNRTFGVCMAAVTVRML